MNSTTHRHERGVTLPFLALSLVGLLSFAGLVVDGSHAYAERRQMQNAVDAGALAGANALNNYLVNGGAAVDISADAIAAAGDNGIDPADVVCLLVRTGGGTSPCPTAANGEAVPADAFRVRVSVTDNFNTTFLRVVGTDDFDVAGSAAAAVQRLISGYGPFMVCGVDPALTPPLLIEDATQPIDDWPVNTPAIGVEYTIWGNNVKGTRCDNQSGSFRGLVDADAEEYDMPGWWGNDTGNRTGPIRSLLLSNNACSGDLPAVGCELVLPICATSNGEQGTTFELYCTRFAGFRMTYITSRGDGRPEARAEFIGAVTLQEGEGEGDPEPGEARVVRLVE